MDEALLNEMNEKGFYFVEPFQGHGGRCYALGAMSETSRTRSVLFSAYAYYRPETGLYQRVVGHRVAFRMDVYMSTETIEYGTLGPFIDGTDAAAFDNYMSRMAIEHLKHTISKPFELGGNKEFRLNSDSSPEQLTIPVFEKKAQQRKRLREDLIEFLSERQGNGLKTTKALILNRCCVDAEQISTVLRALHADKFIHDLTGPELTLTLADLREAEHIAPFPDSNIPLLKFSTRAKPVEAEYDIFLSYAGEDKDAAEALFKALEARGAKCWWAGRQIKWGSSLTSSIEEGLDRSRAGVVLLSPNFLGKSWPEAELGSLLHKRYSTGERMLIPVRFGLTHEEIAEAHPLLRDVVSGEVTDNFIQAAANICEALDMDALASSVASTGQ